MSQRSFFDVSEDNGDRPGRVQDWEELVDITLSLAQKVAAQGKELARVSVLVDRLQAEGRPGGGE